ncbi:hypothetical protein [Kribbella sp. NPDC004536]|uniref:hypothetical protein n=1 Tax=Kribbella sp. NPDC004536 TaxID=3364106 RepID=UPI0036782C01
MSTAAVLPRGVTTGGRLKLAVWSMMIGLRPMLTGYWAVMVVAMFFGGLVIQSLSGGIHTSAWDYATQSPKYFSLAIGLTITPAYFSLLVSHGLTRRMFSVAASIYLTGAAAATSVLWVLVYQLERLLYGWQGWTDKLTNPHLFTDPSQSGLVFAEFFLLILSHEVTGWLLGITFARLGFWRSLLMLPLTVLPAAAAEFLLVAQWIANVLENTGYRRPPLAIAVPAVLAVSALGLYAGYRILQPMALKPPKG